MSTSFPCSCDTDSPATCDPADVGEEDGAVGVDAEAADVAGRVADPGRLLDHARHVDREDVARADDVFGDLRAVLDRRGHGNVFDFDDPGVRIVDVEHQYRRCSPRSGCSRSSPTQ